MGENTKIEWATHTFNPVVGCQKISPACDHCYAEAWAKRAGNPELWNGARRRTSAANWKMPLKWDREAAADGVRARVFCASLADVLDNEWKVEWRADLFALIHATPHLDWLLLTKRIGNAVGMIEAAADWHFDHGDRNVAGWLTDWYQHGIPPKNVWLGSTVINQPEADRDIPKLLATPARIRFLSIEPMLGAIDLRGLMHRCPTHDFAGGFCLQDCGDWQRLHWVICGGESGPGARPMNPAWAQSLRDQCAAAHVQFLFKQWGEWVPMSGHTIAPVRVTRILDDGTVVGLAGKKAAGRLLERREHNGFPA